MGEILAAKSEAVRATCAMAEPLPWRQAMRRAVRDPAELCRRLELPPSLAAAAAAGANAFPLFVPLEFLSRMRPGDPSDPLLRQVLPIGDERLSAAGFVADPLSEASAALEPGLLQKYAGRALLVTTGACAVHCRYCFRRHFPYAAVPKSVDAWQPALQRIAADPTVDEVLLSGGDPLTLVDALLERLVSAVDGIPHVRRLRLHTRLPIVIPQRVTAPLVRLLRRSRATVWMVVHVNHPAELDAATVAALARLTDAGIPVLNQAVLLKGVNDSADVLEALCRSLVDHRVQPYYLHQLDRVDGAAHFEVPVAQGRALMAELRARLPGYAMPQYVREQAGATSKTPLPDH